LYHLPRGCETADEPPETAWIAGNSAAEFLRKICPVSMHYIRLMAWRRAHLRVMAVMRGVA
jgi:hypothetical protein